MAGSKDLGRKLKEVVEDTVAPVGRRVGTKMSGRSDRQRSKADDIKNKTDDADATMNASASSTASSNRERLRGVDRGDGRDDYGQYVGQDSVARDREAEGLRIFERRTGQTPVSQQVRVQVDGSDQARYYDGLAPLGDGRYRGVEVKSGSAGDRYDAANHVQRLFDAALSADNPARGVLNGDPIEVVSVVVIRVS